MLPWSPYSRPPDRAYWQVPHGPHTTYLNVPVHIRQKSAVRCDYAAGTNTLPLLLDHYRSIYRERWDNLWESLCKEPKHVVLVNPFLPQVEQDAMVSELGGALGVRLLSNLPCYELKQTIDSGAYNEQDDGQTVTNTQGGSRLTPLYFFDYASAFPALFLAAQPGHNVLDMCAAPGGKSLVLATQMFTPVIEHQHGAANSVQEVLPSGNSPADRLHVPWPSMALGPTFLTCNDKSPARRLRLQRVIEGYLPGHILSHVKVQGRDATRCFDHQLGTFDRILLDAPCSSERFLAQKQKRNGGHLSKEDWSPRRTSQNAQLQHALMGSAFQLLKPGGVLIYSTCSISPEENDLMIRRTITKKKWASQVSCIRPHELSTGIQEVMQYMPGVEVTEYGYQILPDIDGWGPMYWSVIAKN